MIFLENNEKYFIDWFSRLVLLIDFASFSFEKRLNIIIDIVLEQIQKEYYLLSRIGFADNEKHPEELIVGV